MSECTHDCSSCGESCADRQGGSPFQIKPLHEGCHVRKVYGVVSGKGGVGKSSPQDLVGMVVEKAVKMAQMMNIPIVGLVENMSYLACPDCGRKIYLFGEGKTQEAADRYGLPLLAQMPIDPALAALVDAGRIEDFQGSWLSAAADRLEC